MTSLLLGLSLPVLVLIAWEDWASREIRIWWLLILSLLGVISVMQHRYWAAGEFWLGLGFAGLLILVALLVQWLKKTKAIGGADIWMIGLLPLFAAPVELLWLLVISSWGLMGLLLLDRWRKRHFLNAQQLPLAGALALNLFVLQLWNLVQHGLT